MWFINLPCSRSVNINMCLTSGHASFRMLSPSVCRLTLPLLGLARGTSSPIFPCTSLEIGERSAASPARSSKSPSSLLLAPLENGHSPEIFSSFSFAQNIFPPPPAAAWLFSFFCGSSLSDLGGRLFWSSSSCGLREKFHHLVRSSRRPLLRLLLLLLLLVLRRFKWSAASEPQDHIQYIHWKKKKLHG